MKTQGSTRLELNLLPFIEKHIKTHNHARRAMAIKPYSMVIKKYSMCTHSLDKAKQPQQLSLSFIQNGSENLSSTAI